MTGQLFPYALKLQLYQSEQWTEKFECVPNLTLEKKMWVNQPKELHAFLTNYSVSINKCYILNVKFSTTKQHKRTRFSLLDQKLNAVRLP